MRTDRFVDEDGRREFDVQYKYVDVRLDWLLGFRVERVGRLPGWIFRQIARLASSPGCQVGDFARLPGWLFRQVARLTVSQGWLFARLVVSPGWPGWTLPGRRQVGVFGRSAGWPRQVNARSASTAQDVQLGNIYNFLEIPE